MALALLAASSAYAYISYRWNQVAKVHLPGLAHDSSAAMTILLVGNNTRTGLDPKEASQFGSAAEVGGARSDVTMLMRLDPVRGASILSIPRDLFVPMPPHSVVGSVGKIDAALNDGPEHLVEAITNNLGIPIDHYVSINFDGFQHVVDALGGISMSFPTQLRDSYSGLRITQTGCTHLNGTVALSVVRARHLEYLAPNGRWAADPQSDLSRIRRDHEFLTVFAKAMKANGLTNPVRANAVLGDLVHQVTIDDNFSIGTMLSLLRHYRSLNPETVPQLTLPVTLVPSGDYRYAGGSYGSVVFPTQPSDEQVIDQFLGRGAPTTPPSEVQVVDRSGRSSGQKIAQGLAAAGLPVTTVTRESSPASVTETLVRFPPQSLAAAQQVLGHLAGAALLHADPALPAGTVVVEVGSVVTVASPPAVATASAANPTPAPVPNTTTTVPTPGGQPISASVTPLQSFDPTGC